MADWQAARQGGRQAGWQAGSNAGRKQQAVSRWRAGPVRKKTGADRQPDGSTGAAREADGQRVMQREKVEKLGY